MSYGFVYIWRDSAKSKRNDEDHIVRYYIGRHKGKEDDGYVCSSNWMRDAKRRRPQDFTRRILSRVDNKEELIREEERWLSFIKDNELGKRYYNLRNNAYSGVVEHSEKIIKKIKKSLPDRSGPNHPMYGKRHKEESVEKMKKPKTNNGVFSENLKKQWASGKRKGHRKNLEILKSTQFKKGQVAYNKDIPMSLEQKEKLTGLYYWNNGVICIRSREQPEGFVRGMITNREKKGRKNKKELTFS